MNILHGSIDTASQSRILCDEFNRLGHRARSVSYFPGVSNLQPHYAITAHDDLPAVADWLIPQFDVFNFKFAHSLLPDFGDLERIKGEGKPIFWTFCGSDVRDFEIAKQGSQYVRVKPGYEGLRKAILDTVPKYARTVIIHDEELRPYIAGYFDDIRVVPLSFNPESIDASKATTRDKPLIVHAPTHQGVKGTDLLMPALEKLSGEYEFDLALLSGMPRASVQNAISQATLVIDQLCIGSYGMLSIEAMAWGKPVVCWISEPMQEAFGSDLPIIVASPLDIEEKLRGILDNLDSLPSIGRAGQVWVDKHHNVHKNARQLCEIYAQPCD